MEFNMKIMLLGSGELGKEFAISAKRLGIDVIAVDSYHNAPAHQVSDIIEVCQMTDRGALQEVIERHHPDFIVPEIEAIQTELLLELEAKGYNIVPSAQAVNLTMNRDRIRDFVVNNCSSVRTARFNYAEDFDSFVAEAVKYDKMVIKPCMSSSGKGQSIIKKGENFLKDISDSWEYAMNGMRGNRKKVIIEEFINFDYEVSVLTILNKDGSISFCEPILHYQEDGDYKWSSHNVGLDFIIPPGCRQELFNQSSEVVKAIAGDKYCGGLFGVEFFICKDDNGEYFPIFSELSPRPHDTGMVTMYSQKINQFDLHLRAILGIRNPEYISNTGGVSVTLNGFKSDVYNIPFNGIIKALDKYPESEVRIFGKKEERFNRRMGVILSPDLETGFNIREEINHSHLVRNM